ncbi:hypothetical protein HPB50_014580 [Hyalomma asiaticum]|uniref:Uncharacterized protein n=1 Tax=Hyalomma asiaticum TaxID=266040 RepID=A0ACB7S3V5_HYAAI|nr:hypothetical protein HPB50_014580 [Hyalomma asiaticum]
MASFGRCEPYTEEGHEDFGSYTERFEHYVRATQELKNEPVAALALELKRVAGSSEFEQFLDDAFRDRFVAGLGDETAQAELLKKSNLTFQTAYDLAKSGELTRTETRKIHPKEPGDVNLVQRHPQRTSGTRRVTSKNTERHG